MGQHFMFSLLIFEILQHLLKMIIKIISSFIYHNEGEMNVAIVSSSSTIVVYILQYSFKQISKLLLVLVNEM